MNGGGGGGCMCVLVLGVGVGDYGWVGGDWGSGVLSGGDNDLVGGTTTTHLHTPALSRNFQIYSSFIVT